MRVLLREDVDSLDPNRATRPSSWFFARAISRGLLAFPAEPAPAGADPVPDLASGPPSVSADGLAYTFTLRDGARFGAPASRAVRASDVVASIERIVLSGAGIAGFLRGVAPAAPNDRTVVFRLKHPMPDLPWILAQPQAAIVPAGLPVPGGVAPAGIAPSGPYRLVSYEPERSITFARNRAWDAATDPVRGAYVDRIVATIGVPPAKAFRTVADDDADLVLDVGPPDLFAGTKSFPDGVDVSRSGSGCIRYLFLNVSVAPFAKRDVRLAVAAAVQRARFAGAVPGGTPAPRLLPPAVDGNRTSPVVAENLARARLYLQRAKLSRGFHTTLVVGDSPRDRAEASILRASLARAGIVLTVRRVRPATLYSLRYERAPARVPMGIATWCADWPGLAGRDVLGVIAGPGSFSHLRDAGLARAIAGAQDSEPARASALWAAADARAVGTGALIPLVWPVEEVVTATDLHGWSASPMWPKGDPTALWVR